VKNVLRVELPLSARGRFSGLAAAIRVARFSPQVILLEQHNRLGGLNSYYYRNKTLYETGLHAITNYCEPRDKRAPLNRLLRQLKLRRNELSICQQLESRVEFFGCESLRFSNNLELLTSEVNSKFPAANDKFQQLLLFIEEFDPFQPAPFRSAKDYLNTLLGSRLLVDMLLCPLMYYGSSYENDMDLSQFAIMFRAIYVEGMFRPEGTIKDLLSTLTDHYMRLGGEIRTGSRVRKVLHKGQSVTSVELTTGEKIECDYLISTIGSDETFSLLNDAKKGTPPSQGRLGFIETIYEVEGDRTQPLPDDTTIIFFNKGEQFNYASPNRLTDHNSGVICFPGNFAGLTRTTNREIRFTHLANYRMWKDISANRQRYLDQKKESASISRDFFISQYGGFTGNIIFEDTFTPVTIERYTSKLGGAIYGNPVKIKDGDIGYSNLFLAGTDQGFLGIVGSMLSGVSIVNQHVLPKL